MHVVLYLFIAGFGWIEFETYPSFKACAKFAKHITYNEPEQLGALCCIPNGPTCGIRTPVTPAKDPQDEEAQKYAHYTDVLSP